MRELTLFQRKAVEWDGGALLVLAGPGSGKTRVLTCRVARLLEASPNEHYRILALTFTNKAAHEMKTRIVNLVPGSEERAEINTFHGFCAQLLRQHGVHLGIKPSFEIYSRTADREALLEDALQRRSDRFERDDIRLLPRIDTLKAHMVGPKQATRYLQHQNDTLPETAEHIALAYRLYEEELKRNNALDFNSLIFLAFQLLKYPALAGHCRTLYRYWLIDEFQDTNGPQYDLLRRMAGEQLPAVVRGSRRRPDNLRVERRQCSPHKQLGERLRMRSRSAHGQLPLSAENRGGCQPARLFTTFGAIYRSSRPRRPNNGLKKVTPKSNAGCSLAMLMKRTVLPPTLTRSMPRSGVKPQFWHAIEHFWKPFRSRWQT